MTRKHADAQSSKQTDALGLGRLMRISVFLRSLSLQASWNHERMQNLGLLTTMLPWLMRQPRDTQEDRLFCRRYYGFFNTNPYFANFLIGGLIKLEDQRAAGQDISPALIMTFRDSLGRTFASLGDQLFWLGLRPALMLGCCLLGLSGQLVGLLVLVGLFACGELVLRWVSLGAGYRLGMDIVDLLAHPFWHRSIALVKRLGMILTGWLTGGYLALVVHNDLTKDSLLAIAALILGIILPFLLRRRLPGEAMLLVALIPALLLAFAI